MDGREGGREMGVSEGWREREKWSERREGWEVE